MKNNPNKNNKNNKNVKRTQNTKNIENIEDLKKNSINIITDAMENDIDYDFDVSLWYISLNYLFEQYQIAQLHPSELTPNTLKNTILLISHDSFENSVITYKSILLNINNYKKHKINIQNQISSIDTQFNMYINNLTNSVNQTNFTNGY
jgi:hypothetical protein